MSNSNRGTYELLQIDIMFHYDDHSRGQVTSFHDHNSFNGILHRSMAIALKVAKQMSNIMFHESLGSKH